MNPTPSTFQVVSTYRHDKLTRDGITIFKRYANDGACYYARMRANGKVQTLCLAETADESFKIAKAARREIRAGRWAELHAKVVKPTRARHTLAEIIALYDNFPGVKESTRDHNIHALRSLVLGAQPDLNPSNWSTIRLIDLTDDLVWRFKQKIIERAHAGDPSPERIEQLQRSANSILLQARSLFARSRRNDLPDYYKRAGNLPLPESIHGFRTHPGFGGVEKTEYHAPGDSIVANTLAQLEVLAKSTTTDEQNVARACWLALGFGLRAGEISRALPSDFVTVDGDTFFRPIWRAKNHKFPEIGVQLDAWPRLAPLFNGIASNSYVIVGTLTERTGDVFRRVSVLMKELGWQTTHHVHELRAWAGCQIVAGADGAGEHWEAARRFLRHSQVSTTQNYYGHHFRAKITKVPLPQLVRPDFVPQVVPEANVL